MSAKTELARGVLEALAKGYTVSTDDALQLRNWANCPADSMLTFEEIARSILKQDKDPQSPAHNSHRSRKAKAG